jgi:hypothetical protein
MSISQNEPRICIEYEIRYIDRDKTERKWERKYFSAPDNILYFPVFLKQRKKIETRNPYSFVDFLKSVAYVSAQFPYDKIYARYDGETSTVEIGKRLQDSLFFGEWERAFQNPNNRYKRWLQGNAVHHNRIQSETRRDVLSGLSKRIESMLMPFCELNYLRND